MQEVLLIAQALSDATRVRALIMLRGGELCLCELIHVLGLAPSTVSKHLSILHAAGLVARRKEGKWHYYRLAGKGASPVARAAIRWVMGALLEEPQAQSDASAACCIREKEREDLTGCYR